MYRLSEGLFRQVFLGDQRILERREMEPEYVRRWRHKGNSGYVSTLYHCATDNTTDLCLYDIADKLRSSSTYDIGGTYTGEQPDFWFYYTTSMCHGFNYLLNLFVLPRRPESFSLCLPKSSRLGNQIKSNDVKLAIAYGPLSHLTFRTTQNDEHVYVKTYLFDIKDIAILENSMLLMPVCILRHSKLILDQNTVKTIKMQHNLSGLMDQKETADFTLRSSSQRKYPVHKVIVAAHSPVLRAMLKSSENTLDLDVTDEAMEIIIEFLYTGTLTDLYEKDFMMLLEIADRLKLEQLFALVQRILLEEINVKNAINVAVIAKKYGLEKLTQNVFHFIKMNPDVLTTERWQCLQDIDLVKALLKYIHPPRAECGDNNELLS